MQREVFVVEKERFDLSDEKIYHLQGTWPKQHTTAAHLDGKSQALNPCADGDCSSRYAGTV